MVENMIHIRYNIKSVLIRKKGDVRTVPKVKVPTPTKPRVYSFTIQNISTRTRKVFRPTPIGDIGLSGRRRGGHFHSC